VTTEARPRSSGANARSVVAVPRSPRLQVAGGLFHVTAHSNLGRVVFQDDSERAQFLALLEAGVTRRGWSCRSYCLLSTHYHLLVSTPEPDLSAGIQYVNGRYGQWANWQRSERSHVFEGRFRSILVETESHALEVQRYIALNPVRAGLVRDPEEWPWSSLGAVLGREQPPPFLDVDAALGEFGANRAAARCRLRRFVRDGLTLDDA
jgi:REP-associated tyrosine transposase